MMYVWLALLSCVLVALYWYTYHKHNVWKKLGIKGPDPVPFIGNLHKYKGMGMHGFDLEMTKTYGRAFGFYQGVIPTFGVSDPHLIKQIFVKNFSTFHNRFKLFPIHPKRNGGLSTAEDDHWKFLRTKISPTFTSGKLKEMVSLIQDCCETMLKTIRTRAKDGKVVEMKSICGGFTMDVIASTSFGTDVDSQSDSNNPFVVRARNALQFNFTSPAFAFCFMLPEVAMKFLKLISWSPLSKETVNFFHTAVTQLIDDRRRNKTDRRDFLNLMLNTQTCEADRSLEPIEEAIDFQRGLRDREIIDNSTTFFLAGYETTANALAFTAYCLALHPDIQEKCTQEVDKVLKQNKPDYEGVLKLEYIEMVFSEVLRLYGPAMRFNRTCDDDIDIEGFHLPKGAIVEVLVYALHRDPEFWPDPEKFDPERFSPEKKQTRDSYTYLPFGVGPRNCIGMRLALLEAKMAIAFILQKFRLIRVPETEVPIILVNGAFLTAKNGIYVKVDPR